MESIISDDRIFYVSLKNSDGIEFSDIENPLAQGIRITPNHQSEKWGYLSWFDKINANMRVIELIASPIIDIRFYEASIDPHCTYVFKVIDKNLYNTVIRKLIPDSPELENEEAIQEYLISLNPYT